MLVTRIHQAKSTLTHPSTDINIIIKGLGPSENKSTNLYTKDQLFSMPVSE